MSLILSRAVKCRVLCIAILVVWFAHAANAQLPTIELRSISKPALPIGIATDITLAGEHIDELNELIVTDASGQRIPIEARVRLKPKRLMEQFSVPTQTFDIKVPNGVAPGIADLWVTGRYGISNPRRIFLTDRRVIQAGSEHRNAATAMELPSHAIVCDQCMVQARNYYRVQVGNNQRFRAVAVSQNVDSRARLVMRLRRVGGDEVAVSKSIGAWPAELQYCTPESELPLGEQPLGELECGEPGNYLLEIHDLLFQGGEEFGYLLEAAIESDDEPYTELSLCHYLKPTLDCQSNRCGDYHSFKNPLAAFASLPATEKMRDARGQTAIDLDTLPSVIWGDLATPLVVNFEATAGKVYELDVASSKLDQLTDPRIVVERVSRNEAGKEDLELVAEQDDAAFWGNAATRLRNTDPHLIWKSPETGNYRITLIDNQSGDRPRGSLGVLLRVSEAQPSFRAIAYRSNPTNNPASTKPMGSQLLRGGTESLHVIVARRGGFDGAVEISLHSPPDHIQSQPAVIPSGFHEGELIIEASKDAPAWQGALHLRATAKVGDNPMIEDVAAMCVYASATPTLNAVQSRLCGTWMFAVSDLEAAPVAVRAAADVVELPVGGKVTLPIAIARTESAKVECICRPMDLPPKVALGEFKIPGDQTEATVELSAAGDATVGEYTFWLQCESKVQWRSNPQALEREQAYLSQLELEQQKQDTAVDSEQLKTAIAQSTERVQQLTEQAKPQERTIWIPSSPIRVRISARSN